MYFKVAGWSKHDNEYEYVEKFHFQDSLLICNYTLSETIYFLA